LDDEKWHPHLKSALASLITSLNGIILIALVAAAIGLAYSSYRQFAITAIIWILAATASRALAALATARITPYIDAEKLIQQGHTTTQNDPTDLFLILVTAPHLLYNASSLFLVLITASEFNHLGIRFFAGFQSRPILPHIFRYRIAYGILAVLFSAAPPLMSYFLTKSHPD
jgi:hypothetical protein